MKTQFSLNYYEKILATYQSRFTSFPEALLKERYVILRHDVEFSVQRALEMAKLESEKGVSSTFFFQVLSDAYNVFSQVNKAKVNVIKSLGHKVGLHAYVTHLIKPSDIELENEIHRQKSLFECGLGIECSVFSFHRPPAWALERRKDIICNLINAYGPSFFEYSPNPTNIKYLADSMHRWSYGAPLPVNNSLKIQLLIHPDEWTENGDNNLTAYFNTLAKEKQTEFIDCLKAETKHFHTVGNLQK